jgi:hypothetical protein
MPMDTNNDYDNNVIEIVDESEMENIEKFIEKENPFNF